MEESGIWRDPPPRSIEVPQAFEGSSHTPPALSPASIPVALYNNVLHLLCTMPEERRFWSICAAILHDACKRLDPNRIGLQLNVVQCMAPANGNTVRCLRERVGLGTPPWSEQLEQPGRLFGAQSLVGYVTATDCQVVTSNVNKEHWLPNHLPEHAMSAAASSIEYAGRVAGCLLAVSTRPDFFCQSALLDLIQSYAQLLTLAFRPEDFYEREHIDLQILPSLQAQQSYISTLPQRILALLKKAVLEQRPISYDVAEQRAMWQIAENLLQN